MKIRFSKVYLEDKVVDLNEFEVRPYLTNQDLEKMYDNFCNDAPLLQRFFEDRKAFYKTLDAISSDNRPAIAARRPVYPTIFNFGKVALKTYSLNPNQRIVDKYFTSPRTILNLRTADSNETTPKRETLSEDISIKMRNHPGKECLIEIPDDVSLPKAQFYVSNQGLNFLVAKYILDTNKIRIDPKLSKDENRALNNYLRGQIVDALTDPALAGNKAALLEARHLREIANGFGMYQFNLMASSVFTGLSIGYSYQHPELLAVAGFSYFSGKYLNHLDKHNYSKKHLLRPVEYPDIRI